MSTVAITDEDFPATEELVVGWWRVCQFERLGFAHDDALVLADNPNADLNVARSLMNAGCSHDTACLILS